MSEKYYTSPGTFSRPLTIPEFNALVEMVNSEGWSTFTALRTLDAREAAGLALMPSMDESTRVQAVAIYQGALKDLSFKDEVMQIAQTEQPREINEEEKPAEPLVQSETLPLRPPAGGFGGFLTNAKKRLTRFWGNLTV